MSRIGKAPITVPSGVTVAIEGNSISVKGPKGELARTYSELITIREDGDQLLVERADDDRLARAQHGLVRSLVQNMVTGVTTGFQKDLDIVGVGYRAQAKGSGLELSLGFSPGHRRRAGGHLLRRAPADPHRGPWDRQAAGRPGGCEHP